MKRELAMGINAVEGLLRHAPERIVRAWLKPAGRRIGELEADLRAAGVAVERAEERALDRMAGKVRHQGVIAEFTPRQPGDDRRLQELLESIDERALFLVLDGVQDPGNLGACLRTAAAAGVTAVVIPRNKAVGLTPAARRAAAGAAERVELVVVTNLARSLRALADHGVWRVGLAAGTGNSLFGARLDGALALVLGGEEGGMRRLTREHCDELVEIPMPGEIESLNVSVAAGVALFAAVERRTQ
ncbi:23S rRNA (guanosine(2251)-2'-O)-methyltransferase RlmB [Wenzhouxiangella sediminis]|uniref:23S rRNA (Guanosine(2251)-2'-O)-methyltransferase RlmB n=1 Tax=Wenzhouxiangella sediminis TaxID=1792836 RepID=A0A3E1KD47_9GAMM|nr:23S rRNA (guanosine(2251)-2'-O)-methyltransferase RlmB [Wenzhouxiangella sediminis]RFF32245.1 23S rRNA (guanosine(2251)-2'-O)-methyltransferase RlmB [Wenzhouxiangella sediminis]